MSSEEVDRISTTSTAHTARRQFAGEHKSVIGKSAKDGGRAGPNRQREDISIRAEVNGGIGHLSATEDHSVDAGSTRNRCGRHTIAKADGVVTCTAAYGGVCQHHFGEQEGILPFIAGNVGTGDRFSESEGVVAFTTQSSRETDLVVEVEGVITHTTHQGVGAADRFRTEGKNVITRAGKNADLGTTTDKVDGVITSVSADLGAVQHTTDGDAVVGQTRIDGCSARITTEADGVIAAATECVGRVKGPEYQIICGTTQTDGVDGSTTNTVVLETTLEK